MIYYIIPPVIIVICLAILLIFISKKSKEIAASGLAYEAREISAGGGEGKKKFFSKFSGLSLFFLEKIIQKIKLFSLKFYNFSDGIVQGIKNRRKKENGGVQISRNDARIFPEEKSIKEADFKKEKRTIDVMADLEKKEIKFAPMVSERVVHPEIRNDRKKELEKLLIERIAANPRDVEAYERLGSYYVENNNRQDAIECFRQVLKLSPINRKARTQLRRLERFERIR